MAHRLAWFITYGKWPDLQIDHIDGDRTNNRIDNLRDVDCKTNVWNRNKVRIDSTSGLIGAMPNGNKWIARICRHGVAKYLGNYDTATQAHEVYLKEKANVK